MRERLLMVYFVAILLGVATGIVGSLFQIAIHNLDLYIKLALNFIQSKGWSAGLFSALLSMILLFIAWFMVRGIAPEAGGSGVQEIEGALIHKRPIFLAPPAAG